MKVPTAEQMMKILEQLAQGRKTVSELQVNGCGTWTADYLQYMKNSGLVVSEKIPGQAYRYWHPTHQGKSLLKSYDPPTYNHSRTDSPLKPCGLCRLRAERYKKGDKARQEQEKVNKPYGLKEQFGEIKLLHQEAVSESNPAPYHDADCKCGQCVGYYSPRERVDSPCVQFGGVTTDDFGHQQIKLFLELNFRQLEKLIQILITEVGK